MSGPQSFLDRVRDYVSGTPPQDDYDAPPGGSGLPGWVTALIGAVLGLVLGLLIGWVLWPVEWTGALPPDLDQASRADYISSVADAYVAARNEQAAEVAQQRLRYFGEPGDIAAAIEAAQLWYAENRVRDAGVRINNMNELASALQLNLAAAPPAATPSASAVPPTASAQGQFDITPVPDLAEPAPAEWGWARWLLVMLTGLLLIAGGILVIRRLLAASQTREPSAAAEAGAGFDEEERATYATAAPVDVDYSAASQEIDAYAQRRPAATAADADAYAFEDERSDAVSAGTAPVQVDAADEDGRGYVVAADDEDVDDFAEDDFPEDDFTDDDDSDDGFGDEAFGDEDVAEDDSDDAGPGSTGSGGAAAQAAATGAAVSQGRRSTGRVLGEYTVRYDHGDPDYDASHNIMDAEGGAYIGECGMGVNMKNGILQNNPENVVALDVWLFDKTDERKLETKTAVLVSPQVIARDMAKIFGGERESFDLLQPEPNLRFQLEGGHLVLDCLVKEAAFFDANSGDDTATGVFRTLEIAMTVLRRR